ncbi:MAG: SRPBCC family protein [Chitinophagaceae bacterium]
MSIQYIRQVQKLPITVETAWDFFSSPKNLAVITPKDLSFKITSSLGDEEIYAGQIITYTVKPLLGIPLFWMTEIGHVERYKLFVDEQKKGPYALWHHEHHFKSIEGGVEMTDIVHYKVPFGPIGALGMPIVKKQLDKIFTYRKLKVEELFGTMAN